MKRYLITLVLTTLSLLASAQNLQFGFKAGINIAGESDHTYSQYTTTGSQNRTGFALGGMVNYVLSDRFDLEADLLYSLQGLKDVITIMDPRGIGVIDEEFKVSSHYINVPLALKYYLMKGLYLEAGPQVGFLLNKKDNDHDWGSMYDASNTKQFDFGLFGGLGIVFVNNMFVDARYIHGLTDTSTIYQGGKNRTFQIVLGYYF